MDLSCSSHWKTRVLCLRVSQSLAKTMSSRETIIITGICQPHVRAELVLLDLAMVELCLLDLFTMVN